MDLRIFTEPQQGATYDDLLAVARASEDLGFDAFFRSDHYLHMSGDGTPGPTDAWITLAGLARDTSRIRLGTLVSPATFRQPGPLAVTVAGVDQMSGGRVELGLGAGWFEQEHTAFGIPFPSVGERFDRLEEQLAVITGLWATPAGSTFEHDGPHYPVRANPGPRRTGAARRRADHRRRRRQAAHARPRRPLRRGLQRGLPVGGGHRAALRARGCRVPRGRPRPRHARALRRTGRVRRA